MQSCSDMNDSNDNNNKALREHETRYLYETDESNKKKKKKEEQTAPLCVRCI